MKALLDTDRAVAVSDVRPGDAFWLAPGDLADHVRVADDSEFLRADPAFCYSLSRGRLVAHARDARAYVLHLAPA